MRSNLKNALRDPIVGMSTHMISLTNTEYGILTLKVIRGHQRSLEVKFGMHTHMISLTNIGYDILT